MCSRSRLNETDQNGNFFHDGIVSHDGNVVHAAVNMEVAGAAVNGFCKCSVWRLS